MSKRTRTLVTIAALFGISLAALEITVVGTASPIIVRELGGFDLYSWVFTMYLLTSAISMPFWGRAADHWGRKPVYLVAMGIFLTGSIACGLAPSFTWLIIFRGFKGLGGGGLIPLAFTIIADIYTIKGRAKLQGFISSIWGVSSLIGPFIGGALADTIGWRFIFFINLIPGGFAFFFFTRYFHEKARLTQKLRLSFRSLFNSVLFIVTLLASLHFFQRQDWTTALLFLLISIASLMMFFYSEKKTVHPLIPPQLFKHKVFTMTCITGFLFSAMLIGMASFIPLLFQVILNHSPTVSGLMLFPFTLSWVIGSIFSTRLLLKVHYKKLLGLGMILTFTGLLGFMLLFYRLNVPITAACIIFMGLGMALNYPILLITTQYDVPRDMIGFATSAMFWVRNIGSTIGISLMGITLALYFKTNLMSLPVASAPKTLTSFLLAHSDTLLKPKTLAQIKAFPAIASLLHTAIFWAFMILLIACALGMMCWFFFPNKVEQKDPGA